MSDMGDKDKDKSVIISGYADELVSVPRGRLVLELMQHDDGVRLSHDGRVLVECRLVPEGMMASGFMAQALGVSVPALGESVGVRVSTGVLFRALGIAGLDFGNDASFVLLDRLLDEAEMQRGASSGMV